MKKLIFALMISLGIPSLILAEDTNKTLKEGKKHFASNIKEVELELEVATETVSPKKKEFLDKLKETKDYKKVVKGPQKEMHRNSIIVEMNDILCHKFGLHLGEINSRNIKSEKLRQYRKVAENTLFEKYHTSSEEEIKLRSKYFLKKAGEIAYKGKDYATAYDCFSAIVSDDPWDPRILECAKHLSEQPIKEGGIVLFGHYEQDNNLKNGPEPIQWIVLAVEDGKAALLSKFTLDAVKFAEKSQALKWEKSDLRKWLNNEFYNQAFNEKEKQRLIKMEYSLPDSYRIMTINITKNKQPVITTASPFELEFKVIDPDDPLIYEDYVLCPSEEEVTQLFNNYDTAANPTFWSARQNEHPEAADYAISNYWLRGWGNITQEKDNAIKTVRQKIIKYSGDILTSSLDKKLGIRPLILLALEEQAGR